MSRETPKGISWRLLLPKRRRRRKRKKKTPKEKGEEKEREEQELRDIGKETARMGYKFVEI